MVKQKRKDQTQKNLDSLMTFGIGLSGAKFEPGELVNASSAAGVELAP